MISRKLCVFDPAGKSGDYFQIAADYRSAALEAGVRFELLVYTDEAVASEELAQGRCDAALITGSRARRFNRFTGTIEAIGALPGYEDLRALVSLLSSKKLTDRLRDGKFETSAVFPAGKLYLLFRDRRDATLQTIAGKRLSTLTYDVVSRTMVQIIGASLVPAEVATFAGMFNNGAVEVCYSPVSAIAALELLKGVGTKGGILRVPLAQITLQLISRSDRAWPEGFSLWSRSYSAKAFDLALKSPERSEARIEARHFIEPSAEQRKEYEAIFLRSRLSLRAQQVYDPTMLRLMRRLRCRRDPRRAECANRLE